MTDNFLELMTDTSPQIQEAQKTLSSINTRKSIPRYMIFKLQKTKDKEKILKETIGPQ